MLIIAHNNNVVCNDALLLAVVMCRVLRRDIVVPRETHAALSGLNRELASWKLGLETPAVWDAIAEYMGQA